MWQRRGEGKGEEGDVLLCRLRNWVVWVVRRGVGGWVAVDNRCGDNGVLQRSQVHMMLLVQRTVFFTTLCIMLLTQPSVKCSFCSCVD